ncbi:MAG: four helix bundle protein [Candidatus Doudnabacteria bacterium]|nr:four helix bundle protein [Candidatus Doudnabacteria bacterium]
MPANSYKNLTAWIKAIELVQEIYVITDKFPKMELYILVNQMLRAAISVPSNIAEGYRRNHRLEYIQFLSIAIASAAELETQLIIAKNRYPLVDYQKAEILLDEIQRLLYVTIRSLKGGK